jgi:hypothetical protein
MVNRERETPWRWSSSDLHLCALWHVYTDWVSQGSLEEQRWLREYICAYIHTYIHWERGEGERIKVGYRLSDLARVAIAVINTMTKNSVGRSWQLHVTVVHQKQWEQEPRGKSSYTGWGAVLLNTHPHTHTPTHTHPTHTHPHTHTPCLLSLDCHPRGDPTHNRLSPPTLVTN